MPDNELQRFLKVWDAEAQKTAALLRTVPAGQYDFRPDAGARSVGELAWHLAEVEAYISYGIEQGTIGPGTRPPGIERPKSIEALAPEYERVHAEAAARLSGSLRRTWTARSATLVVPHARFATSCGWRCCYTKSTIGASSPSCAG